MADFRYAKRSPGLAVPFNDFNPTTVILNRPPTSDDLGTVGQIWVESSDINGIPVNQVWILTSPGFWTQLGIGGAGGVFTAITATTGSNSITATGVNTNTITGTTNINDTTAANTDIGSGVNTGTVTIGNANSAAVDINGPTFINIAGAADTSINTGGNTGTVTIGSATSTAVDIAGPLFLNASVNKGTAINTGTSTGSVTIGNLANAGAVSLNSAAASNFTVSGAGVDLTLSSVLGSTIISATEVDPAAIQLTTAATGGITVNASSAALICHRAVNVDAAAGVNAFTSTSLTTGVAGTFTSSAATVDSLRLIGGGLKVTPVLATPGASPVTASGRFGIATFTDVINAAATGALSITNTMSTAASLVFATVQCTTVGSALIIRDIDVSVAGTITCNITNLGGTNTGADITVTFWLWN